MFAVIGGSFGWKRTPVEGGAEPFVMPRLLRRPMRFITRFATGNVDVPQWANAAANAGLIAAALAFGTIQGGHGPQVVASLAGHSGFAIEDVRITGHTQTSEIDILGALGLDGWTSLVGFDAESARQQIAAMPWVKTVSVRKTYPSGLDVKIEERSALALWQDGDAVNIIDAEGKVIAPYVDARFSDLPLLTGQGAPEAAAELMALLKSAPSFASQASAFIRVGGRRWDMRLANGLTVKLPETGAGRALADLARLDAESGLLARDIAAIDLRIEGQVAVRLTGAGAAAHDAAFETMIKSTKKKDKRT